jgi:peptidase YpeB-like protein
VEERVRPLRISRRGVAAVVVLFVATLLAAQTCQQSQVRVTQEQAIATARERAGFTPERTQIRLVRQGLTGDPYWAISFSVPARSGDGYARLTTVRVDANSGKVEAVNRER